MPHSQKKPIIYHADDDANQVSIVKSFLSNAGFEVSSFTNGKKLLEALRAETELHRVAAVVLDGEMPEMGGLATRRAMEAEPRLAEIPAILHSTISEKLNRSGFAAAIDKSNYMGLREAVRQHGRRME